MVIHFKFSPNIGLSYSSMALLIGLSLLSTITEMFGLSIFLPIFQYINLDGDTAVLLESSFIWEYIIGFFSLVGIDLSLVFLLLIAFSSFLARQILTYIRLVYRVNITQKLNKKLCDSMFADYLAADTDYHDGHPVGDLVNAMTTEARYAVGGVMAPIDLIISSLMTSGYLVLMFMISWEMTLFFILTVSLAILLPRRWVKMSAIVGRKYSNANSKMTSFLVNRLKSPRIVRLAGTSEAEKNEFDQLTTAQCKHSITSTILQSRTKVVLEPVIIGLSLFFLYISFTFLHLELEMIGLYLIVVIRLMPSVKSIVVQWQIVQRYLGSIESVIKRIKDMVASLEEDRGTIEISELNNKIEFRNISYAYPGSSTDTLNNISFIIKYNTVNAIVGPSGSGKSTLVDLLLCLRSYESGDILFDDNSIKKYNLLSLRKLISYAPQSPQIFPGTVAEHIRYGKPYASENDLKRAAQLSGADQFIDSLEYGYETFVGEDAVNLSGGQRQRIDLARALISESPILILDEPSSNLDAESEEMFRVSLKRISEETNITIVIVSHRLESISLSNQIIVLKQGKIEDQGSHNDLIIRKGWYAKAWKLQHENA